MSIEISRADIMNAYLNPLVSRQVTLKIKSNTIAFVLEPSPPEFVERQRGMSRTSGRLASNADKNRRPSEMVGSVTNRNAEDQSAPVDEKQAPVEEPVQPAQQKFEDDRKWTVIKDNQKLGPLTTDELNDLLDQKPVSQKILIKNIQENKIWTYDYYVKTCKNKDTADSNANRNVPQTPIVHAENVSADPKDLPSNISVEPERNQSDSREVSIDEEPLGGANYFRNIDLANDPHNPLVRGNTCGPSGQTNNGKEVNYSGKNFPVESNQFKGPYGNQGGFALKPQDRTKQKMQEMQSDFQFNALTGEYGIVPRMNLHSKGEAKNQGVYFSDDDSDDKDHLYLHQHHRPNQKPSSTYNPSGNQQEYAQGNILQQQQQDLKVNNQESGSNFTMFNMYEQNIRRAQNPGPKAPLVPSDSKFVGQGLAQAKDFNFQGAYQPPQGVQQNVMNYNDLNKFKVQPHPAKSRQEDAAHNPQDPAKMFDPSIPRIPVKNPYMGNPPPDFPSLKNFSSSQINAPIQKAGDSEVSNDSVEEIQNQLKGSEIGSSNPQNDPYYLIRELKKKNNEARVLQKLPPKSNELSLNINKNSLDNSLHSENSNANKKEHKFGADPMDRNDNPNPTGAQVYISRIMNKTSPQAPPPGFVPGPADPFLLPISQNPTRAQPESFPSSNMRPENRVPGNDIPMWNKRDSGSFNRSGSNLNNSLSNLGDGRHPMGGPGTSNNNPSNSYVNNILRANNPNLKGNAVGIREPANYDHNEQNEPRPGKFIEEVFHSEELKVLKDSNIYRDLKLENIFERDTIMIPPRGNPPVSEILNSSQIKDPVLNKNDESFTSNKQNYSNSFGNTNAQPKLSNAQHNNSNSYPYDISQKSNTYTNAIKKNVKPQPSYDPNYTNAPYNSKANPNARAQPTSSNSYINRMQQMNKVGGNGSRLPPANNFGQPEYNYGNYNSMPNQMYGERGYGGPNYEAQPRGYDAQGSGFYNQPMKPPSNQYPGSYNNYNFNEDQGRRIPYNNNPNFNEIPNRYQQDYAIPPQQNINPYERANPNMPMPNAPYKDQYRGNYREDFYDQGYGQQQTQQRGVPRQMDFQPSYNPYENYRQNAPGQPKFEGNPYPSGYKEQGYYNYRNLEPDYNDPKKSNMDKFGDRYYQGNKYDNRDSDRNDRGQHSGRMTDRKRGGKPKEGYNMSSGNQGGNGTQRRERVHPSKKGSN
jgi:hypothetical protein